MSGSIEKLRMSVRTLGADALIVSQKQNVRYLSGFTGSSSVAYISPVSARLITDFRYIEQAQAQTEGRFEIIDHQGDLFGVLNRLLTAEKIGYLAIEAEHTSLTAYRELEEKLTCRLVESVKLVERLRKQKSDWELHNISRAVEITDKAFAYFLSIVKPGVTERAIADRLESFIREQGGSSAFDIIVASGERGALPHGHASDKRIAKNEFITLDMGAVFEGYCSDLTRTICLGEPDKELQKIYQIVLAAADRGIDAVRAGVLCRDVDKACRDYIAGMGYGAYFGHGTGHGIGLNGGHELPKLNETSEDVLLGNEVITIEPGIYIPGLGGVRIEDDIVVGADTGIRLTTAPRELLCL